MVEIKVAVDDRRFKKYITTLAKRTKQGTQYFTKQMVKEIKEIYTNEATDTSELVNSVRYVPGQKTAQLIIGNEKTTRRQDEYTSYSINYARPVEYGVSTGAGKKFFNERTQKWQKVRTRPGINAIERSQPIARFKLQGWLVTGKGE